MRQLSFEETWPESWRYSYPYDLMEVYGETDRRGYAYAYANRKRHALELVQKVAPPGARILDVAAGQGNFSLALAEQGFEVTWNDLREELAGYVELKRERGVIHYAPGEVFTLGFDGCFDVVLITEIIEHVAHPDEFLRKIARFVRPSGYVVMTTPNGGYFRNPLPKFSECQDPEQFESRQFRPDADGHIFLLHLEELRPLSTTAGLSILETRTFTNPLMKGYLRSEPLLRRLPRQWVDAVEQWTCRLPQPIRCKLHTGLAVLFQRNGQSASLQHPLL